MPQKVIRFTGINRKVNEFQTSGECEELINLRPTATGVEVAQQKAVRWSDVKYDTYYEHAWGDQSNDIAVLGGVVKCVTTNTTITDEFEGDQVSLSSIGNLLIAYCKARSQQLVFKFSDGAYTEVDATVPDDLEIKYSVTAGYGYSQVASLDSADPKSNEFKAAALEHWSAALGENSRVYETFGPVLVAFNFSLDDGSEFWTNKWIYVNPFLYLPTGENGKKMIYYESGDTSRFVFNSFKVTFQVSQKSISTSGITNKVQKLNVYASRPVFPYDLDTMSSVLDNVHDREIYATAMGAEGVDIASQLLYYQRSIPISDIEAGDVSFTLDFGSTQAGERVLEVDNGPIKRAGKNLSYNNRVHVYDSTVRLYPQSVTCLCTKGDAFYSREAYVYLDCDGEEVVMKTTALVQASSSTTSSKVTCFYPDARATKILIANSNTGYSTINLTQSSRYNFSWGEALYGVGFNPDVVYSGIYATSLTIHEANTINVSAQYNPFVFPVEHSYSIGGAILDLVTTYLPISSVQIGQYPLTVFTKNGIFALEQGSGSVLYGNIVPLSPYVADVAACTSPHGTFFISSKTLYLLAGREAVNMSQVLDGEIELNIRDTDAYKKLCCSGSYGLHDFSAALSGEEFEDFIQDAVMTYDQFRNELIISSNDVDVTYSYVLNLDTKSYHKIEARYLQCQNGARYALADIGGIRCLVHLHKESEGVRPILLQSRPMHLEAFLTHIHRLILMADANVTSSLCNILLSVFASDNLHDWRCIISAQKQDTVLRQIRTNRAAKSYRDYVVLINGIVPHDTDISDLIADYTVVNRRLG